MGELLFNCSVRDVFVLCILLWCCQGFTGATPANFGDVNSVKLVCGMAECNCTHVLRTKWYSIKCEFDSQQKIHFRPGSFPNETQVLEVIGGKEIEFAPTTFTQILDLQKIRLNRITSLTLKRHSFLNLTTSQLFLDLIDCDTITIETGTFDGIGGTLWGLITNINYLLIQNGAFSYLLHMEIKDVDRLELQEGAFNFKYPTEKLRHSGESVIIFENVHIIDLPSQVFQTVVAAIKFTNTTINTIRKNAFTAIEINNLTILNSTISSIESNAFMSKVYFKEIKIIDSRIDKIKSEAILSASNNITILRSTIKEIESNGINMIMSISVEILNSTFGFIGQNAFNFHGSIYVNIFNNIFLYLANNSFNFGTSPEDSGDIYYISPTTTELIFHFISNKIYNLTVSSLKFLTNFMLIQQDVSDDNIDIRIEFIEFPKQFCGCQISKSMIDWFGTSDPAILGSFNDVCYCLINDVLSLCYNVKQGGIVISQFVNLICVNSTDIIQCPREKVSKKTVIETITNEEELIKTKLFHTSDDLSETSDKHYLYLIIALSIIFLIILLGGFVLLLVKGGLWLKKKGYCMQFRRFNQYSSTAPIQNGRSSIIEEITTVVPQEQHEIASIGNENKLNENLPNDLTHDLLQTLREQLNNPDSYQDAREMIERLYDHFLREEPPYDTNSVLDEEEEQMHLYEELNARGNPETQLIINNNPDQPAHNFLRMMEEKLNVPNRTILSEYSEPMDTTNSSNNSQTKLLDTRHIYSELPITNVVSAKLQSRPLPKKPQHVNIRNDQIIFTPSTSSDGNR